MKVYILEDEIVQQFRLESLIKHYLQRKKYPVEEVAVYGRSQDLLSSLEESSRNNIYFLDIAIKGKTTCRSGNRRKNSQTRSNRSDFHHDMVNLLQLLMNIEWTLMIFLIKSYRKKTLTKK